MTATSIAEIQRFTSLIASAGGTVPNPVRNLLHAYDVLTAPSATDAPGNAIMDHALAGTLDEKTLQKLLPGAAAAHNNNQYRGLLARDSEHSIVGQIHREFRAGGADSVLSSLREKFTEHAEAIAAAKALGINSESTLEHIVATGEDGLVTAWRELPVHIAACQKIGQVAAMFAVSPIAWFPQIREYGQGENFKVSDIAVFCGGGDSLVIDSAPFLVPSGEHKNSPWFRIPLKLQSVATATARYRRWCAAEHDRVHGDRPRGGRVGEDGVVHLDAIPPNPFREGANA